MLATLLDQVRDFSPVTGAWSSSCEFTSASETWLVPATRVGRTQSKCHLQLLCKLDKPHPVHHLPSRAKEQSHCPIKPQLWWSGAFTAGSLRAAPRLLWWILDAERKFWPARPRQQWRGRYGSLGTVLHSSSTCVLCTMILQIKSPAQDNSVAPRQA